MLGKVSIVSMKGFLTILFFTGLFTLRSQNTLESSSSISSVKARDYNNLAFSLLQSDLDSAYNYADTAHTLAITNADQLEVVKALRIKGLYFSNRGMFQLALDNYNTALVEAKEVDDDDIKARILSDMGNYRQVNEKVETAIRLSPKSRSQVGGIQISAGGTQAAITRNSAGSIRRARRS